jgi:hypothetical protein
MSVAENRCEWGRERDGRAALVRGRRRVQGIELTRRGGAVCGWVRGVQLNGRRAQGEKETIG